VASETRTETNTETNTETKTEANVQLAVPFLMVTNMDASLRFYIEGLGFQMKNKWIDNGKLRWCWLEIGAAAIMVQDYLPDRLPKDKLVVGSSTCFQCKDAIALYREFISRGIAAQEPFVGNNMWVTTVQDPDGHILDFESLTDVPEETKLSEWKP
jgi:lactoylglutathione lyase